MNFDAKIREYFCGKSWQKILTFFFHFSAKRFKPDNDDFEFLNVPDHVSDLFPMFNFGGELQEVDVAELDRLAVPEKKMEPAQQPAVVVEKTNTDESVTNVWADLGNPDHNTEEELCHGNPLNKDSPNSPDYHRRDSGFEDDDGLGEDEDDDEDEIVPEENDNTPVGEESNNNVEDETKPKVLATFESPQIDLTAEEADNFLNAEFPGISQSPASPRAPEVPEPVASEVQEMPEVKVTPKLPETNPHRKRQTKTWIYRGMCAFSLHFFPPNFSIFFNFKSNLQTLFQLS